MATQKSSKKPIVKGDLNHKPKTIKKPPPKKKAEIVKPVLKKSSPPPKIPLPKPIPAKKVIDYDIDFEEGNLCDSHQIVRVKVMADGKEINAIGKDLISNGFGQNRQKAVEDFINRNNSFILNKIFDKES